MDNHSTEIRLVGELAHLSGFPIENWIEVYNEYGHRREFEDLAQWCVETGGSPGMLKSLFVAIEPPHTRTRPTLLQMLYELVGEMVGALMDRLSSRRS